MKILLSRYDTVQANRQRLVNTELVRPIRRLMNRDRQADTIRKKQTANDRQNKTEGGSCYSKDTKERLLGKTEAGRQKQSDKTSEVSARLGARHHIVQADTISQRQIESERQIKLDLIKKTELEFEKKSKGLIERKRAFFLFHKICNNK